MKTCSILITNYNSFEAIQLCIESIYKYTTYPGYRVIVHNDRCINGVDSEYLRLALEKGLINELYESETQLTHGGSLNVLLHEKCTTDYAAIIDCDIVIRGRDWLEELVFECERQPKTLAVVDFKAKGYAFDGGYRTGIYLWWFGLLNMNAYRDGMQVNWRIDNTDRRDEPYLREFADLYPPEENAYWQMQFKAGRWPFTDPADCPRNKVCNDPGSKLYMKVKYDNPNGYQVVPLTPGLRRKHFHFEHISMISIPAPSHCEKVRAARETRFAAIRKELAELRSEA